jgi:hypothetical protein
MIIGSLPGEAGVLGDLAKREASGADLLQQIWITVT